MSETKVGKKPKAKSAKRDKITSALLNYVALVSMVAGFLVWYLVVMVYPPVGAVVMFVVTVLALVQWFRKRNVLDPFVTLALGTISGAASYSLGVILGIFFSS